MSSAKSANKAMWLSTWWAGNACPNCTPAGVYPHHCATMPSCPHAPTTTIILRMYRNQVRVAQMNKESLRQLQPRALKVSESWWYLKMLRVKARFRSNIIFSKQGFWLSMAFSKDCLLRVQKWPQLYLRLRGRILMKLCPALSDQASVVYRFHLHQRTRVQI